MASPRKIVIESIMLILTLAFLVQHTSVVSTVRAQPPSEWPEAEPVRVLIQSTADWGRILFDDLNGTNANGLKIKSVLASGWLSGQDFDDTIDAGRKLPWPDEEYGQIVVRHADLVGFFKGLRDFRYTEAYADLVLQVDVNMPQVYVWLMSGGNGTTTFEITSLMTNGIIWRDVIVGNGVTQQVRRVMSPQPFFRPGRTENLIVIVWLGVAILVVIILNLPFLELLYVRVKRARHRRRERNRK